MRAATNALSPDCSLHVILSLGQITKRKPLRLLKDAEMTLHVAHADTEARACSAMFLMWFAMESACLIDGWGASETEICDALARLKVSATALQTDCRSKAADIIASLTDGCDQMLRLMGDKRAE